MTRPAKNKIYVVTGTIAGKFVDTVSRTDTYALVWDEGNDQYIHSAVLTTASVTYETLDSNGDVGVLAGQLAIGNHTHDTNTLVVSPDTNFVTDAELAVIQGLSSSGGIYSVTLSAGAGVAAKIIGATTPAGWTLGVGSTSNDIEITHNKNARVAFVSVFYISGTEEIMLFNTAAYNGIRTTTLNSLTINSIATGITSSQVKIYIMFE